MKEGVKKRVGLTYSDAERVQPYVAALEAAGLETVLIPPGSRSELGELDGLVLSGGIDLNPALYGQELHPETDAPDDARDRTELALLREALDRDVPVLAICRGMQLFNVAHGGTLEQHIEETAAHQRYDLPKREPVHLADVEAGSKLAEITGAGPVRVNSRHHQAVAKVGYGLVVSARSGDGVIEGVERPDRKFAVAVQWHPEDQAPTDPVQAKLFADFAASL
jgi:putative glutamine amidotransferase